MGLCSKTPIQMELALKSLLPHFKHLPVRIPNHRRRSIVCSKMKALVVTTSGKLSLRKVEDPPAAAIVDDEVLIKVAATALNCGEVPVDGTYSSVEGSSPYPDLECFGTVLAGGRTVARWKVGDQFFSGIYAITCAPFAFLRPGDELLAVAGAPYDTLEEVIGIRNSS